MPGLVDSVRRVLREHDLDRQPLTLLAAVSGGPDSIALFHLLARLRDDFGYALHAAYVDHGLRPHQATGEAELVRESGRNWNVPVRVMRVDTPALVHRRHLSIEAAARELRYQALRAAARDLGADLIAVAHTADDQVETILLHMLRGSGRRGLAGMRVLSRDLFRPLLGVDRGQILSYVREQGIRYCQDESNRDLRFTRNRIRHRLLPFLEQEFGAGIRGALLTSAENLAEDEAYLDEQVERLFNELVHRDRDSGGRGRVWISRRDFRRLPACQQRRLVEKVLWSLDCPARNRHILAVVRAVARGRTNSELHLSRGLRAGIERERVIFTYPRGRGPWRGRWRPARS